MPILSTDIHYRYSGGAANATAAASLGGAKSSAQITSAAMNNLYDNISGDEAAAGDIEYRCVYVHNAHASLTLENAVIWIDTNTPSPDTLVEIGLGSSAIGGAEQTVANEGTAPAGVTFSAPATKAAGLAIGNLAAGQSKAVWLKRTVNPAAAAFNSDGVTLRTEGDTSA